MSASSRIPISSVQVTALGGPTALLAIGSLRLLTDPTFEPDGYRYLSGATEVVKTASPAVALSALPAVDAVLLSHDQHNDNLDPAGRAYLTRAGCVLTTPEGAQRLGGNALGVATWETITLEGAGGASMRVTAMPARHGPPEVAPAATGSVNGWVLEWEGQHRGVLYISGDTVLYEGLEDIARRYTVSVALLHFGAARVQRLGPAHLTLTGAEGAELAKMLGQATVIPIHYEGWTHLSEGRDEIERAFAAAGIADRLRVVSPGDSITVDM
ncbi:MAG TPA: MBL fold metallo-hydrolase [Ktedonobacterales bacterium]